MKKFVIATAAGFLPTIALAQINISDVDDLGGAIYYVLNLVFPILVAIAVFVVVWGIFKFVLNAGDEEARKTGRSLILWGVIGIFLMLSVWGLVNIVRSSVALNNESLTGVDDLIQF